jgi:hypothetical protein
VQLTGEQRGRGIIATLARDATMRAATNIAQVDQRGDGNTPSGPG